MSCSTASVKSASRNFASRSARAFTVSLNSRVNPIGLSSSLFGFSSASFALPVVGPPHLRRRDFLLLTALRPAGQQDHHPIAVPSKVDSISWSEIDPKFVYPASNTFHIRKVAKPDASKCHRDLGRGASVEAFKPAPIWAASGNIEEFKDIRKWYHTRYQMTGLIETSQLPFGAR